MKQLFSLSLLLLLFVWMLCFPQQAFLGASKGLLLWFQTLLPTLLPFMVLSNLLVQTRLVSYIARFISPIFHRIFGVSTDSSYVIFIGFCCGYPMGAKVIGDCVRAKCISKDEGQYLLSFCNNCSLMYIISFLVTQILKDASLLLGTLCILLFSPIFCSFLFRIHYQKMLGTEAVLEYQKQPSSISFQMVDESMMNSFEAITKIGGYVILCSVLCSLASSLPVPWVLPLFELTSGTYLIASMELPLRISYPLLLGLTSFGGICAIFQTHAMIYNTGLSLKPYIIQKLITAMVTSSLAHFYMSFIH